MKTTFLPLLKRIATPGFLPESVVVIGSYCVILLLIPLDVMSGAKASFHVFYIFPVTLIALHSSRNDVVIGATVLSISLQLLILVVFEDMPVQVRSYLFLMILLSNSAFALTVRFIRLNNLEAKRLSTIDPLTQLFNRRALENAIDTEMVRQKRYGGKFSVALIDLDGFKGLNDLMGHKTGDEALILLADILRTQTRQSDTIARLGGDEFVILMPNTQAADCNTLCQALCHKIGVGMAERFSCPITASIGYTTVEHAAEVPHDVLMIADKAMYQAKSIGKGCVVRGYALT